MFVENVLIQVCGEERCVTTLKTAVQQTTELTNKTKKTCTISYN